jgi:hypothetical protein
MPESAAIGVLLACALVVGVAVGTLIGAVFLRAAVALYNKMAGGASSPSCVPEPALGKAMWIIFAAALAHVVVGWLVGEITVPGAPLRKPLESLIAEVAGGVGPKGVDNVAELFSIPIGLLIMAGILSAKLPTTFGRALLVTLCYLLVVLPVVGVLVGIAVLVFGVA